MTTEEEGVERLHRTWTKGSLLSFARRRRLWASRLLSSFSSFGLRLRGGEGGGVEGGNGRGGEEAGGVEAGFVEGRGTCLLWEGRDVRG